MTTEEYRKQQQVTEKIELLEMGISELSDTLQLPIEKTAGKKRRQLAFMLDDVLVSKIKSAFVHNRITSISAVESGIWSFINKLEREFGTLPAIDPSFNLSGLAVKRKLKLSSDARLAVALKDFRIKIAKIKADAQSTT